MQIGTLIAAINLEKKMIQNQRQPLNWNNMKQNVLNLKASWPKQALTKNGPLTKETHDQNMPCPGQQLCLETGCTISWECAWTETNFPARVEVAWKVISHQSNTSLHCGAIL